MRRFICILILLSLMTVPASATGSTEFTVRTDKDTVSAGDVVTCTVSMGAVENLFGLKLKVNIPEGLTLVEGSGTFAEDHADTFNAAQVDFFEDNGVFIVGGCDYTGTSEIVLFQFQCTVDEAAADTMEVFLEIDPENVFDKDYENIAFTVATATLQKNEPVAPACEHTWKKESGDENGHWFDCSKCDLSRIEAHVDSDGNEICDVCNYDMKLKESGSGKGIVLAAVILVLLTGVSIVVVVFVKNKPKKKVVK